MLQCFTTPPINTSAERVLPPGVDYLYAHLWSVVRATDSGVIIAATPGPKGEGFAGDYIFWSEVPNLTCQKGANDIWDTA